MAMMLGTAEAKIVLNIGEMMQNADRAQRRLENLDKAFDNQTGGGIADRLDRVGQSLDRTGKRAQDAGGLITRNFSLPFIAAGASMIKTSMDFEAGMNRVKALTGETGDGFVMLRDQAIDLSKTTRYTATEAADAMGFLAMAGNDVNEIYAMMPDVLNLAAAGSLDLGRSADLMTNIMQSFGMEADQAGRAADVLTAAFTGSNTSMEQLADAMKYVAPVARSVGWDIEQTAAAIGLLGNAGIQGSMAGTALRNVIVRLSNPTGKAAKRIEELGLELVGLDGNLKGPVDLVREFEMAADRMGVSLDEIDIEAFSSSIEGLEEGLAGIGISMEAFDEMSWDQQMEAMTAAGIDMDAMLQSAGGNMEFLAAVMDIMGVRGGPQFLALLAQGSEELEGFTGKLYNAAGRAAEVADTMMEGLGGALNILRASWGAWMITLGDAGALDIATNAVNSLSGAINWLNDLSPEAQRRMLLIGGAAAALGPGVYAAGTALRVLGGALRGIGGTYAWVTGPLLPFVLAAGAGFAAWKLNLFGFRDAAQRAGLVGSEFMRHWRGAFDAFRGDGQGTVVSGIKATGAALLQASRIAGPFGPIMRDTGSALMSAAPAVQEFTRHWRGAYDAFRDGDNNPVIAGLKATGVALTQASKVAGPFGPMLRTIGTEFLRMPRYITRARRGLNEVADSSRRIKDAWDRDGLQGVFRQLPFEIDRLTSGLRNMVAPLRDWTLDVGIPTVTGWLRDAAGDAWAAISTAAGWAWDGLVSLGSWVLDTAAPTVVGWIASAAVAVWPYLADAAGWAWDHLVDLGAWTLDTAVPNIVGWIVTAAGNVWDAITTAAGWAWGGLVNLGGWVLDTAIPTVAGWVAAAALAVWPYLSAAAGWAWSGLVSLGSWTLETAAPAVTGWLSNVAWPAIRQAANWTWDNVGRVGAWTLEMAEPVVEFLTDLGQDVWNALPDIAARVGDFLWNLILGNPSVILGFDLDRAIEDAIGKTVYHAVDVALDITEAFLEDPVGFLQVVALALGAVLLGLAAIPVAIALAPFLAPIALAVGLALLAVLVWNAVTDYFIRNPLELIEIALRLKAIWDGIIEGLEGLGEKVKQKVLGALGLDEDGYLRIGVGIILDFQQEGDPAGEGFDTLDNIANPYMQPGGSSISQFGAVIGGGLQQLRDELAATSSAITQFGTDAGTGLSTAQASFVGFVGQTVGVMGGWTTGIQTQVNSAMDTLRTRTSGATAGAKGSITTFVADTIGVMGGWSSGTKNMVNTTMDTLKDRASGGTASAKSSFNTFTSETSSMMSSWAGTVGREAGNASSSIERAVGRWPGIVGGIARRMYGAGADAIQGLVNGANSRLGALEGVVNRAIAIMSRIPSLGRSPWPMMIAAGTDAMDGLMIGTERRLPALNRTIDDVIGIYATARPEFATSTTYRPGENAPAQSSNGPTIVNNDNRTFLALTNTEMQRLLREIDDAPQRSAQYMSEGFTDVGL